MKDLPRHHARQYHQQNGERDLNPLSHGSSMPSWRRNRESCVRYWPARSTIEVLTVDALPPVYGLPPARRQAGQSGDAGPSAGDVMVLLERVGVAPTAANLLSQSRRSLTTPDGSAKLALSDAAKPSHNTARLGGCCRAGHSDGDFLHAGPTPARPPLPNPNGYDDFLKAASLLTGDVGQLPRSTTTAFGHWWPRTPKRYACCGLVLPASALCPRTPRWPTSRV